MLLLHSKKFPESAAEFAQALDAGLRLFVDEPGPIVDVSSRVFPYLDEIVINLDGAEFNSHPPVPPCLVGGTTLACEAAAVTLSAQSIAVRGAPFDLRMEARDVVFHKGQDEDGHAVLLVHKVGDGSFVISASQLNLENAITEMARREGRKHGITIEQVRLAMRARGVRSIAADVRVEARKFLLRANIDIYGQLDIDEDFVARISQLKCRSDGAIGALACGTLEPYLQQLEGKIFSLTSLPLGEIQLRDVRIAVANTVEITADFGSNA
jgi:hypothetical protein